MDIFTNWIFWVVIAAVIFVFALIGFLTDKKKKAKEVDKTSSLDMNNSVSNEVSESSSAPVYSLDVDTASQEGEVAGDDKAIEVFDNNDVSLGNGDSTSLTDSINSVSEDAAQNLSSNFLETSTADGTIQVDRNQVNVDTVDINSEKNDENGVSAITTNQGVVFQDVAESPASSMVNLEPSSGVSAGYDATSQNVVNVNDSLGAGVDVSQNVVESPAVGSMTNAQPSNSGDEKTNDVWG